MLQSLDLDVTLLKNNKVQIIKSAMKKISLTSPLYSAIVPHLLCVFVTLFKCL